MSRNRRLSIPVSEDLYQRFTRSLPWGERTNVVIVLLEQLCEVMEKEGMQGLAKIYLGRVKIGTTNEELSENDLERAVGRAFRHTKTPDGDEN